MFRIDRRFVKISGSKAVRANAEEDSEVGATDDGSDAAASAEDMAKMYMSAAERDLEERAQAVLAEAREKARTEAASIVASAVESAEEERRKAYEEGFAKGDREGRQAYDAKLAEQRSVDEAELRRVLDEIAAERARTAESLEEDTVALAVEIVRKIFNPAEEELGNVFISLIKNALRQMSSDNKFVIRVGPSEYERFFSSGAAEIELDSGAVVTATVLRDVALEEGDLIIDTEDVTVNAGLNSQLKYVQLAFQEAGLE